MKEGNKFVYYFTIVSTLIGIWKLLQDKRSTGEAQN